MYIDFKELKKQVFAKMPRCVTVDCRNNTFTKNREKDVSFYNLPKDLKLRKRWLANIKRENIPKYPKICHQYFEDSCFKRELEVIIFYRYKA